MLLMFFILAQNCKIYIIAIGKLKQRIYIAHTQKLLEEVSSFVQVP